MGMDTLIGTFIGLEEGNPHAYVMVARRNELYQLLKAALSENMLNLTDEQIRTLVDYTFDQVDSNGK